MEYLVSLGFENKDISFLNKNVPSKLMDCLIKQEKLVCANINYIKSIGIENYQDMFMKFYDMFLLDNSLFKAIFDKYDTDDLIEKIKNNVDIVEYL